MFILQQNNKKLITKREEVTKQDFCNFLQFIHSSGWGGGERLFEFDCEEEGVGAY